MTQSAQNERAQLALNASGITGAPLMSLERDDALFVLTDDMLVYQDGGGTRRVTLRDLTRIHSDQAGLLRVETPAGTALTASLLGFDVAQVQSFFKGVRSATARAKDLPDSPTPTLGGAKTFGSAPAAGRGEARVQAADTDPAQTVPEVAGMPQPSGTPEEGEDTGPHSGRPAAAGAPLSPPPGAQADGPDKRRTPDAAARPTVMGAAPKPPEAAPPGPPAPAAGNAETGRPEARSPEARKGGGNAENPVVISSSSFSPHASRPGLGAGGTPDKSDTPRLQVTRPEAARAEPATPDVRGVQPPPTPHGAPAPADAPISAALPAGDAPDAPPVTALSKVAAATALARQAGTVEALAGRLRMLGAVLFVGALALAFFQFTGDQALAGLWTLLAGGVGAIALLALGELSALLALLARAPGPTGGSVTDRGSDS